jgi:hypothetical protein
MNVSIPRKKERLNHPERSAEGPSGPSAKGGAEPTPEGKTEERCCQILIVQRGRIES